MNEMTTPAVKAAREYAQLLLKQHELDPRGEKESAELDSICEAMNSPWERMDGWHRRLMKGLSIDLYALADGRRGKLMLPEHQDEWRKQGAAAQQTGDPAAVLEHLRQAYPYGIPLGWIPFLQAQIWAKIGFRDVAILFLQKASKTIPAARTVMLDVLEQLGRADEARELANRLLDDKNAARPDVYVAAATLFVLAAGIGERRRMTMDRIIPPLERILREERQAFWFSHDFEMCITRLLALALGEFGRNVEANKLCTDAINRFPDDMTLITTRAFVNFETDPKAAKADFRTAVDRGATIFSPYVGLAWFMLQESDYVSLLGCCDQALRFQILLGSTRAWLFEWRGIALAETGESRDRVEEEFSRAADLAPERIEQIQANRFLALSRMQSTNKPIAKWRLPGLKEAVDPVQFTEPPNGDRYTAEMLFAPVEN